MVPWVSRKSKQPIGQLETR